MVLGFYDLVSLRDVGMSLFALVGASMRLAALVDKVGFFFFGVLGMVIVVVSEAYYRKGARSGCLMERFLTVTVAQLIVITSCGVILRTLLGLTSAARTPAWIVATSAALAALSHALARRLGHRAPGWSNSQFRIGYRNFAPHGSPIYP